MVVRILKSNIFDKTRKWAYCAIRKDNLSYEELLQMCIEKTLSYNANFSSPLSEKSLLDYEKYRQNGCITS